MRGFLVLFLVTASISSYALDREVELELRSLEQRLGRVAETNERLLQDIRQLQRENQELKKMLQQADQSATKTTDALMKLENIELSNLQSAIKVLTDRFNTALPDLNWGSQTRDCPGVGKHQKIGTVANEEGRYTLRFLCFDGRALHLGTELHEPPQ